MPVWLEELAGRLGWLALVVVAVWGAAKHAVKASIEKAVEKKFREWEVRFSKLHERRVGVLEAMYGHLVETWDALESVQFHLVTGGDPREVERILRSADEATAKAHRLLLARSFYLPKKTGERIESLVKEMKRASLCAGLEHRVGDTAQADLTDLEAERFGEHFRTSREELRGLIADVEDEFRRLVEG